MRPIWTWLNRERPVAFVVLALLAVLMVVTGIVPSTIGGWHVQGAVLAVLVVALVRGSVALWAWNTSRPRRARTGRGESGSGD